MLGIFLAADPDHSATAAVTSFEDEAVFADGFDGGAHFHERRREGGGGVEGPVWMGVPSSANF